MVDRNARNILAQGLSQYLDNEIDNLKLDECISNIHTDDLLVLELRRQVWLLYDDFRRHRNEGKWKLPENIENGVRRWVQLLRSDTEWTAIKGDDEEPAHSVPNRLMRSLLKLLQLCWRLDAAFVVNEFWPFRDCEEYRAWEEEMRAMKREARNGR